MKRVLSLFISLLFSVSLYSNPSVGITIGEISVSISENMEDVVKKWVFQIGLRCFHGNIIMIGTQFVTNMATSRYGFTA